MLLLGQKNCTDLGEFKVEGINLLVIQRGPDSPASPESTTPRFPGEVDGGVVIKHRSHPETFLCPLGIHGDLPGPIRSAPLWVLLQDQSLTLSRLHSNVVTN